MKLLLERMGLGLKSTLGELSIVQPDGSKTHLCWTLEDTRRRRKVPGVTCIPGGTYVIVLRTVGGKHEQYLKDYPDFHLGMLWLENVPGFEFVLIHRGNTDKDSEGCILVGEIPMMNEGEFTVGKSGLAYEELYKAVVEAAAKKELAITIQVREPHP